MGENDARGTSTKNVTAPHAITNMMYPTGPWVEDHEATPQVYFFPDESRGREGVVGRRSSAAPARWSR